MTICAGFCVRGGVLLCSDTEWSGGTKVYQDKILSHAFTGGVVAFALAGDEGTAKTVVEEFREALPRRSGRPYSPKEVKSKLRQAIRDVHISYVDSRPTPEERSDARFDLVVAVALKGEHAALFTNSGPSLVPVDSFTCVGCGWHLAKYIINLAYSTNMPVEEAVIIALQALSAAKREFPNIGGPSQFLAIVDGFVSPAVGHDPQEAERLISNFERLAGKFLLHTGDLKMDDGRHRDRAVDFVNSAIDIRAEWKRTSAGYQTLLDELTPKHPKGSRN